MLGNSYEGQNCSAARALEFVGERWSLLIIRDALFGNLTRFGDFQRSLGVASNVLAKRLEHFVSAGLMKKSAADERTHERYLLTKKGRDLLPVLVALTGWGDRWAAENGPPVFFTHECGGPVVQSIQCSKCGSVDVKTLGVRRGPGFDRRKTSKRDRPTARSNKNA